MGRPRAQWPADQRLSCLFCAPGMNRPSVCRRNVSFERPADGRQRISWQSCELQRGKVMAQTVLGVTSHQRLWVPLRRTPALTSVRASSGQPGGVGAVAGQVRLDTICERHPRFRRRYRRIARYQNSQWLPQVRDTSRSEVRTNDSVTYKTRDDPLLILLSGLL
jgi:hypothetical protein